MSGSDLTGSCFLTCIKVSQEAGKVVWYYHLLKIFPQCVVIHTVKGFDVINKAEVDVFLVFSCFFDDPMDVGNLISCASAFSESSWTSGSSQFTYCGSLSWRILSITLLVCEMCAIVQYFEHSLALPFFGMGMKTDIFQSCGHCWVFQSCWHMECSTFTASYFGIWNSSPGIPSPPLALFIVMLHKAQLTLHFRMSAFRLMITPSWLCGSWRSFLRNSSVYTCHLFLYLLLLLSPYHFCALLCPSLHEMFPWYLFFLMRSPVFPILLFSSMFFFIELWGRLSCLSLLLFGTLYSDAMLHCRVQVTVTSKGWHWNAV